MNLIQSPDPGDAALAERVRWVREAAADRVGSLELQLPLAAVIPSSESPADAVRTALGQGEQFLLASLAAKFDPGTLAASPLVLTGTAAEMADKLARLQELHGIGSVMIPMSQLEALAPVIPLVPADASHRAG